MSIWFDDYNLEDVRKVIEVNMLKHLGIELVAIGDDSFEAKMPVDHRTTQPMGLLHGGASCVLAESLGSIASYLCIDPEKNNVVGLEINANHIRSVKSGFVYGICIPLHLGRTSHIWDIRIHDESGNTICVSRLTNAVLNLNSDRHPGLKQV